MDTTPLQDAYRALLKAAATVADSGDKSPIPPAGEWNADQILAHVAIVNAVTITAVSCVASGANTTYDNRMALDIWTIDRVISHAGGNAGLHDRIAAQGDALSALGAMLSEPPPALAARGPPPPPPTRCCPLCCFPTARSWSISRCRSGT
jgi:hypothetical protein